MAHEVPCKHCGWWEFQHEEPESFMRAAQVREGRMIALVKCEGYVCEDPELEASHKAESEKKSKIYSHAAAPYRWGRTLAED